MHQEQGVSTRDQPGTILVVDDDEGVRRVLALWVESLGHSVVVAADAAEAMKVLGECEIDVALCDVQMPGRDGIWLFERIQSQSPGTSVAFLTGLGELDARVTLRPGVVGYLVKPFNRPDLGRLILRGLEERRARGPRGPAHRSLPEGAIEGTVVARS